MKSFDERHNLIQIVDPKTGGNIGIPSRIAICESDPAPAFDEGMVVKVDFSVTSNGRGTCYTMYGEHRGFVDAADPSTGRPLDYREASWQLIAKQLQP
jgi:hypothetical protein